MAKANRKAIPNIKGVKLDEPSPPEDAEAHKRHGFEYGLEYADRIISFGIIHHKLPDDFFADDMARMIRHADSNCRLIEGFLSALVILLAKSVNHHQVADLRTAVARERAA